MTHNGSTQISLCDGSERPTDIISTVFARLIQNEESQRSSSHDCGRRPAPDRHRSGYSEPSHDPGVAYNQHHHCHQWSRQYTIDDSRPVQSPHRIEANEVESSSEHSSYCYRCIKGARIIRSGVEGFSPTEHLADCIRRRSRQNRHGQQSSAYDAKRKQCEGKPPAIGRSASAACADVATSTMPCECSVAAVANTIASDTSELKAIPTIVSRRIRASSGPAVLGVMQSGLAW